MIIRPLSLTSLTAEVARLRPPEADNRELVESVSAILTAVRARGDEALVDYTRSFDWPEAESGRLRVPAEELEEAFAGLDPELKEALELSRRNSEFFHRHEVRADWQATGGQGQRLGVRYLPVRRAGLYVPGGLGSYASSVVMNVVPAQVAGVKQLAICTPPGRDGRVNPSVLAAARLLGVTEVYRVGGAQAIGALAYGTSSIPRVDVISGPGNAYVNEAKRQVFGLVGIDSLAGPSEVLVVADETADPVWVAADLLAQEEHGSGAQSVLLAPTRAACEAVAAALVRLSPGRASGEETSNLFAFYPEGKAGEAAAATSGPRVAGPADDTTAASRGSGPAFLSLATALVNEYAPEHLEVHVSDARAFLPRVEASGAIFLGAHTPTTFGDYVAGSNHVLPTGGSSRFASALSVDTFMKKLSVIELGPETAAELAPPLAAIADAEGFSYHRLSALLRAGREGGEETGAGPA
jgi:histidinol dehydrogenase